MKWYDYRPCLPKLLALSGAPSNEALLHDERFNEWIKSMERKNGVQDNSIRAMFLAETAWCDLGRPYYDLYPGIAEAFLKVDLSKILVEHLSLPYPVILIRLSEGNPIGLCTVLVAMQRNSANDGLGMHVCYDQPESIKHYFINTGVPNRLIAGFKSPLDRAVMATDEVISNDRNGEVEKIVKIVTTMALIRNNPDIIEQQPLSKDLAKFDRSVDFEERQRLLDKAKRRGKLAFAIGKHIETAAGFRNPHFAIRWMGHGEPKTPVLRPISGCIVNRKKIMNVPTGFLDDVENQAVSASI